MDEQDAVRQACVDFINEKRATLDLPPLARASADAEMCTDEGSMSDSEIYAETGVPHSSAGECLGGAQNTCPLIRVGGWGGAQTLEDALFRCLQAMWDEGEPPQGREACEADATGCFQAHGHYLNMTRENASVVSCGFYEMRPGEWWSNQDFDWQRSR